MNHLLIYYEADIKDSYKRSSFNMHLLNYLASEELCQSWRCPLITKTAPFLVFP